MIDRHGLNAFILLTFLFVSFSSGIGAEDLIHVVVRGDTVYSISRLYGISQDDLMRNNGIADASKLRLGMRLVIPARVPPAVVPAHVEYTVLKNDTLYSIARSRGVTLQALREINGFSKNYVLKVGEKIKIPAPTVGTITTPMPTARAASKLDASVRWPIAATEILRMNNNAGVLISGKESESIKSLTRGVVVHASPWRGYGNVAVIETEGGYRYLYGSCETLSVKKGDSIEPGTELGKLGIYAASGRPDLVFMVSQNGLPVDPAKAPRF
jgi:murein DD-endopeptidase MepM/ murein hydrolase activator NlpD